MTILTSTTVVEIREGEVVLQDADFDRRTLAVDDVVTCHTRPETGLLAELRAAGVHVLNVGDSVRPRNLYHAVQEGSAFGLEVDEHLLFNPNGAILNELPIDVLAQLTRDDGPSYTARRMLELAGVVRGGVGVPGAQPRVRPPARRPPAGTRHRTPASCGSHARTCSERCDACRYRAPQPQKSSLKHPKGGTAGREREAGRCLGDAQVPQLRHAAGQPADCPSSPSTR